MEYVAHNIINLLAEKAKEFYDLLVGAEILYTDGDYSNFSYDINDFYIDDEEIVQVSTSVFLANAPQTIISLDDDGNVEEAVVWTEFSPDVKFDMVNNIITASYYDYILQVPVLKSDIEFDMLPSLIQMHKDGVL